MKSEVNPVVGGIFVVILLAIVGFFLWRGTGGGAAKSPGSVGNPGPFAPGGAANNKGGKPSTGPPGSRPTVPGNTPGQSNPPGR